MPDYTQDINKQRQDIQSLTDRLKQIDEITRGTTGKGIEYIQNLPKAELESPFGVPKSQLALGSQALLNRAAAREDLTAGQEMLAKLLGLAQQESEFGRQYSLDLASVGIGVGGIEGLDDATAIAQVKKIYGKDIVLGNNLKERGARARDILLTLQEGGQVPIQDLLTPTQKTARDAATNLLKTASEIQGAVVDENGQVQNATGVGLLGAYNPGVLLGAGGVLRAKITELTAAKIKEISGAAVSDREVARLSKYLPKVGDSEAVIKEKTDNIIKTIEIGLQMQEKMVQENIDLDDAYRKYAAPLYIERGLEVPDWIGSSGTSRIQTNTNDLVSKYWGD